MSGPTARELLNGQLLERASERVIPLQALAARVEKVLKVHQSVGITVEPVVEGITVVDERAVERCMCGWEWPCPTVRLLNGEER